MKTGTQTQLEELCVVLVPWVLPQIEQPHEEALLLFGLL